jgi:hydrogenase nickel incorporation protein HypA/HybF
MHELSVAEEIINITNQYLPKDNNNEVISVKVEIGRLSNILVDSLNFCFDALIDDTPLNGAKLLIKEIPITVKCEDCGNIMEIDGFLFQCKNCESTKVKLITGNELKVTEIEIND